MPPRLLESALEIAYTGYLLFAGYVIASGFLFLIGWLPLRKIGRRLRDENASYDEFVREHLIYKSAAIALFSFLLIPCIAAGVIHRSLWGRAFRNLYPSEAEEIANTFLMSKWELRYSKVMLFKSWVVLLGLITMAVVEASLWLLGI